MTDFDIDGFAAQGGHLPYAGPLGFMRRPFTRDLDGAAAAVLGAPLDLGVSNRSGTRFGPRALREMSVYQFGQVCPLGWFEGRRVVDYGDSLLLPGDMDQSLRAIENDASTILDAGARLLTLGGDHTISLPLLRAHARAHGTLSMIHFDSHTDTYDIFDGPWHGSIFESAVDEGLLDPARSVQLGIRAAGIGEKKGYRVVDADAIDREGVDAAITVVRETVGERPAYITFDVDFLDPAYAPGTGTPVAGGPTTAEARRILLGLAGLRIVGGDVVEVSPPFDGPGQITSLAGSAAAFHILELMLNG